MTETYRLFIGIDWATQQHAVSVTDATGTVLGARRVDHTGIGITALIEWVMSFGVPPQAVAVALEMPSGPLVDGFLERGCHVFAINPKQLDRFRDRFSVAGMNDDDRDAAVLSSALRTDRQAFRALGIDHPLTIQLREYTRQDAELGEDLQRLTHRLRDHLLRTWPELLRLVPAADEAWLWALLALAPTAAEARRLRRASIERLLRAHRIRRLATEDVLTVLRTPSVTLAAGVRDGVRVRILDLVEQLAVLTRQRRAAERRLAETLARLTEAADGESSREQTDGTILQSLPGIGTRIAATLLAEAAHALRQRDYHALRQLGGIAPVTKCSGKSRIVTMRYACNHRLQTALYMWASNCIYRDSHCRAHYRALRRAGRGHARALRGVVDRMLAVLTAMLKTGTLYDPLRRRAALEQRA